jgi:lipid-binding SYLF domain-containing protein
MTKKLIAFAFFFVAGSLVVSAQVVSAQDISGRYKAEGTDPEGTHFSETAVIEMMPDNTCRIKWSGGIEGICIFKDNTLSVGYIVHGKAGLGVYKVTENGDIEGTFIDNFHGGGIGKGGKIGTEKMTPIH